MFVVVRQELLCGFFSGAMLMCDTRHDTGCRGLVVDVEISGLRVSRKYGKIVVGLYNSMDFCEGVIPLNRNTYMNKATWEECV